MSKSYDLAVVTSKYTDRNGNEKANWENIGAIFEKENGGKFMTLKATFNPAGIERKAGSDSIVVSMFPVKDKEQRSSAVSQSTATSERQQQSGNNVNEDPFYGSAINDMPF